MSERVTAEQVEACLAAADRYVADHQQYQQEIEAANPQNRYDEENLGYGFRLNSSRMPEFVSGLLIEPPFSESVNADHFDVSLVRNYMDKGALVCPESALVLTFLRSFKTPDISGSTSLRCKIDFPEDGRYKARMDAEISAGARNHTYERFKEATDRLLHARQLEVRLEDAGLEVGEKSPERLAAEEFLEDFRLSGRELGSHGMAMDIMPFLSGEDKDLIHHPRPMTGQQVEALGGFITTLQVRDRQRTGYEALCERFGTTA